jgi:uncharacterized protein
MMFPQIDTGGSRHTLAGNVMHFGRLLRAAGLKIGPGRVIDCVKALELADCNRREDWYWAMSAVLLSKQEQRPIFDQAFHIFWRDPKLLEKLLQAPPRASNRIGQLEQELSPRLSGALFNQKKMEKERKSQEAKHDNPLTFSSREVQQMEEERQSREVKFNARLTYSSREVQQHMDFDAMSASELAEAKRMLRELRLPLPMICTRRYKHSTRGARVDLRTMLRKVLREGGDVIPLVRAAPIEAHSRLIVLCDISGSMNPYARMFLHFLHAITNDSDRVSVFVFGTRLTNITCQIRHRDVDVAMCRVADTIKDWSGGTRIGSCLREFNWRWSRRVLGQSACLLLVSDGLDLEAGVGISKEMQRLRISCKELVWLNPLLHNNNIEPLSAGVRAMLPQVDRFLPVNNLKNLIDLAHALAEPAPRNLVNRVPNSLVSPGSRLRNQARERLDHPRRSA